ncbi:hypothetical protein Leryth_007578 [Lithospermum erythrorhizon]|uniref:Glycosyltransferase n=1 Tax=Lithospermum erythrorhizon TaxID=34254 RepID=A0AAV3NIK4_LITER|nr:hypothetical protein Leryth_007578 [Lithospermum erythrorhizon]
MAGEHQKPHAIMIPYPYQGHITPFVYLAMKLASNGFTITFINTHSVHYHITNAQAKAVVDQENGSADIFAKARELGLDIRYATVNDGFPLKFDRSLNHDQFMEGVLHVLSSHVDDLVENLVEKSDPPITCLIADTFFVWGSMVARKYNLVHVSFWTEPALVLTLYYHLDLLRKNGHFGSNDNRKDIINYIPGVDGIEPRDLMSYLQATDIWSPVHRIIYKAFEDVKKADMIICNTVQELELQTLSALNEKQPTYAIGPIVPAGFNKREVPTSLWSESDCTQWLNKKPHGSVLYVSFGSYAHLDKNDLLEIAYGLMLSGVNFLWVLRPDIVSSDVTNFLPQDFLDGVKDRGLIVNWCCQIAVVSHQAIGGFLSHCGWNSTLESIWCGVPLICFPLLTDQFSNRKLVVNDWKIGINLCDESSITRQEVCEKLKYLMMNGENLSKLSSSMKMVSRKMANALEKDGSSENNFRQFIEDVKAKSHKRMMNTINGNQPSSNGYIH